MPKTTDSVIFSDAQQEILERALQNPELSNSEIAAETGYRLTLIRDTRREYEDDVELAEDVAGAATDKTAAAVDADLSATEEVILDLVAENPQITNADIAEQTGARIALVRDTRNAYGDRIESQSVGDAENADSEPSGPGEPSAAQQEILSVAAEDPTLSNSEIAEKTGARITLVRDTLAQYDGPSDADGSGSDKTADAVDTEGYSDMQAEILEAAAATPEATNRELAEQTGARITLVRDTLADNSADKGDDSSDGGDSDDRTDVLDDVDTSAFSGAQLQILETALANPELTNSEIAAETDSRVAFVRDTIDEYEYDDKPWVGNVEESDDSDDEDEDDEIVVDSDDEVEIPDTTAADLFNDRQRAILEAALEDPDLTNSEIATQTGARLTLVRDTRATYEEGVELATDDDGETTSTSRSSTTVTFSDRQKAIIAAAEADEEASIAEIAAETDSRIPLVRDTLAAAADADRTTSGSDDTESAADDPSGDDADDTAPTADEPSVDDGVSEELLVAVVVVLVLLIGIAALLL